IEQPRVHGVANIHAGRSLSGLVRIAARIAATLIPILSNALAKNTSCSRDWFVRVQIKRSLGQEPEEVFKQFTPEPFAAASLGQVHHAITKAGERVAVKVSNGILSLY
ncbi:MAG TPA: AarF/UbiB family protein, partial [Gammaproteobacteria bacterium]|nr:AarF/UbiB family protein [Gammaproteobacteria bacterium]